MKKKFQYHKDYDVTKRSKSKIFEFFTIFFFEFLSSILCGEHNSQPKSLKLQNTSAILAFSFFLQK